MLVDKEVQYYFLQICGHDGYRTEHVNHFENCFPLDASQESQRVALSKAEYDLLVKVHFCQGTSNETHLHQMWVCWSISPFYGLDIISKYSVPARSYFICWIMNIDWLLLLSIWFDVKCQEWKGTPKIICVSFLLHWILWIFIFQEW